MAAGAELVLGRAQELEAAAAALPHPPAGELARGGGGGGGAGDGLGGLLRLVHGLSAGFSVPRLLLQASCSVSALTIL